MLIFQFLLGYNQRNYIPDIILHLTLDLPNVTVQKRKLCLLTEELVCLGDDDDYDDDSSCGGGVGGTRVVMLLQVPDLS